MESRNTDIHFSKWKLEFCLSAIVRLDFIITRVYLEYTCPFLEVLNFRFKMI